MALDGMLYGGVGLKPLTQLFTHNCHFSRTFATRAVSFSPRSVSPCLQRVQQAVDPGRSLRAPWPIHRQLGPAKSEGKNPADHGATAGDSVSPSK